MDILVIAKAAANGAAFAELQEQYRAAVLYAARFRPVSG
jgi:hypothetical protein